MNKINFSIGEKVSVRSLLEAMLASEMANGDATVRGSSASGGTNPTCSLMGKIDIDGNRFQVSGNVSAIAILTPAQQAERKLYKQLDAAKQAGVPLNAAMLSKTALTEAHKAALLAK